MTALLCKYRHFESSKPLKLSICNLQPRIFNQIESKATHYSAFFVYLQPYLTKVDSRHDSTNHAFIKENNEEPLKLGFLVSFFIRLEYGSDAVSTFLTIVGIWNHKLFLLLNKHKYKF